MNKNTIYGILILVCLIPTTALFAQISRHTAVPATLQAEFQRIGQIGNVILFNNFGDRALLAFNATTGQLNTLSIGKLYPDGTFLTPEGIYWSEEVVPGRGAVYYWSVNSGIRQKLYEFEGFSGSFLGATAKSVVAKAGEQVVVLDPSGWVRNLASVADITSPVKGSWRNMVYWFDAGKKILQAYRDNEQRPVTLGQFTNISRVHPAAQDLWIFGDSKIVRTDGTENGGRTVFDGTSLGASYLLPTVLIGDSVWFFNLYLRDNLVQTWRTNGTPSGTYELKTDGSIGSNYPFLNADYAVTKNGQTFYIGIDRNLDLHIWRSNGTVAGTVSVENLTQKFGMRYIRRGVSLSNERMVLFGVTLNGGEEPAIFEGDRILVFDIRQGIGSSAQLWLTNSSQTVGVGNSVFLPANDGEYGQELWQLDGSNAMRVGDLAAGSAWSNPVVLGSHAGRIYWLSGNRGIPYAIYSKNIAERIAPLPAPRNSLDWFQSIQVPPSPISSSYWIYAGGMARTPGGLLYVTGASNTLVNTNVLLTKDLSGNAANRLGGDNFLVQLDQNGLPRWRQKLPGSHINGGNMHVAPAPEEGVYWAGVASGEGEIGGQSFDFGLGSAALLVRLSSAGRMVWHRSLAVGFAGFGGGSITHIRSDAAGNVFVAGMFTNFTASIGNFSLSATTSPAGFVAQYRPDGSVAWAKAFPADADWRSFGPINGMAFDASGNLYALIGMGGQNYQASCGIVGIKGRIICIDKTTGTLRWQKNWEGNDYWYLTDVAVSPSGIVHVLGSFRGILNTAPFETKYTDPTPDRCNNSGFLARLDRDGNLLDVKILGQNPTVGQSIAFDDEGNYYIAGYQEVPSFVTSPAHNYRPFTRGRGRAFVQAYNPRHELLGERSFGIDDDFTSGGAIELLLTPQNKILLMGEYKGMVDTLPGGNGDATDQNVYLMQFALPLKSTTAPDGRIASADVRLSPNPATNFAYVSSTDPDLAVTSVEVFDMTGRALGPVVSRYDTGLFLVDISQQPVGAYQMVIQLGEQRLVRRLVKM
jgi:ELWxxDGT repeat protein